MKNLTPNYGPVSGGTPVSLVGNYIIGYDMVSVHPAKIPTSTFMRHAFAAKYVQIGCQNLLILLVDFPVLRFIISDFVHSVS